MAAGREVERLDAGRRGPAQRRAFMRSQCSDPRHSSVIISRLAVLLHV
jgi:hypothetical protein